MESNSKKRIMNICVMLSSYNGEKYIREQLESINNQSEVNVFCYIRDDGSTDNTVEIINNCISNYDNFKLFVGTNIGVNRSFLELLFTVPDNYDFYAFADQDDIWFSDKLIRAINKLSSIDKEQPALYCSNLTALFENGDKKAVWKASNKYRDKRVLLIHNWAWGCTEVFNNSAMCLCLKYPWKTTSMHDYWLHLLCAYFGVVIYDQESRILYRQHNSNVVGIRENTFAHMISYIKELRVEKVHPRQNDAKYLLEIGMGLEDNELREIKEIAYYDNSLSSKIKLLFNFRLHMLSISSDIAYRIRIIRGIV